MGPITRRPDRWLAWAIAAVALTGGYAAAVAVTGGFKFYLAGFRFSSQSWQRPATIAAIGAAVVAVAARAPIAAASAHFGARAQSSRGSGWMVLVAAIWTLSVGIGFGTF